MTSSTQPAEAYVWIWLPGECEPVVAGVIRPRGHTFSFNYGQSYLQRPNAIPLAPRELPLRAGVQQPLPGLSMPGCLRDGSPDAWGRRVIINRKLGLKGAQVDPASLDELTYLLESGSDRIGALDFQCSARIYEPRILDTTTLTELLQAVQLVEAGLPLSSELERALFHGSSIGGARPKALLDHGDEKLIAKFSSSSDIYNVIKAEFIAMRLAKAVGLEVVEVKLQKVAGKDVLLIQRFDRKKEDKSWSRRLLLSALSLLELDEMMARYASYEDLAEIVRHRFANPTTTLRELFSRMVFNVLCGNTDDHARNHAAFWDGKELRLSPAYDICPQGRSGREATQAMLMHGQNRLSQISTCLQSAHSFLLKEQDAREIIDHQIETIERQWMSLCDEAELGEIERNYLWKRQFLNPFAFE